MFWLPENFNWKNPDYLPVLVERQKRLLYLREHPEKLPAIKAFYRKNIGQFIHDWGWTYDTRLEVGTVIPFLLFERQREWVQWFFDRLAKKENGITPKSRELGMSWLAMSVCCSVCQFEEGRSFGFGSQVKADVDNSQNPDSLFWKGRFFIEHLPEEFRGDWNAKNNSIDMQLLFPETACSITGDCGDDIGRGGRKYAYIIDESAHLQHPVAVEASLSNTTNCRIDISSVKGANNPFGQKMINGVIPSFLFHWRAQPLTARILTPTGWTTMGELSAGDEVFGIDGLPKKVLRILPQPLKEVFRVTFDDGASTECCGDHLWSVIPYGNHRAERRHIRKTMSLSEISSNYRKRTERGFVTNLYQIPLSAPIHFAQGATLPVDPYVMGALLGDGSFPKNDYRPIVMSQPESDVEIISLMNARLPVGCALVHDGGLQYRVSVGENNRGGVLGRGRHNPINYAARALGLAGTVSHTKFVPKAYLLASHEDRLDLLQGLMDTDGNVAKSDPNAGRFTTVSPQLAADMVFLAQSLGGTATVYDRKAECRIFPGGRIHDCRKGYTVVVRLPMGTNPFKMARKADAYKPSGKRPPRRSIINIESVGEKAVQCIEVEGHLYLTDDCVVTHNCDPRKDDAWYEMMKIKFDPITIAQEVDIDLYASVEGILIPSAWVQAAIDADKKLFISPTGIRKGALDVADEGRDANAFAVRHGILLDHLESWKGAGSDIFETVERAFMICDVMRLKQFDYDADGMGTGVRGDARVINERRETQRLPQISVLAFQGSGGVDKPNAVDKVSGRANKDMFANRKAQGWWALRYRFQQTYRAVVEKQAPDEFDHLISLPSDLPDLGQLCTELSQPTYSLNSAGKILVDKAPEGSKSPNLADSVMYVFASAVIPQTERDRKAQQIESFVPTDSSMGYLG